MPETNTDFMARRMDDELKRLEDTLTALYANATNEVTAQFTDFSKGFDKQAQQMQYLLQQGAISESEYYSWVQKNVLKKAAYQELVNSLTKTLVNTDKAAMALVRGELPYVIAQSYNFVQSLGWKAADDAGLSVGTFQIYNAEAVQKLIKDNPRLLPKVDTPKDKQWNHDRINNTITHAIMQGDDMPTIAKQLQQVANMDKNTAMRTARTATTYAENLGRDESYLNLKAKGLPVRKKWSAVIDGRTRDTHRQLNNTYANKDDLFGEGILVHLLRCPADPTGDAEEIYNCRCRLGIVFDNSVVDHSNDDEAYEKFLQENYPDDYTKLKDKDYFRQHTSKPQTTAAAKPTYKTASNRKEADAMLKDMGFVRVSSGTKKIDEQVYLDNVNRLSELNSRFKAITPNMSLTTGEMKSIAYVQLEYGKAGSTTLKLSTRYFNGDDKALNDAVRHARTGINDQAADWAAGMPAFWMPFTDKYITTYSITHEFGHMLQNKALNTAKLAQEYNEQVKKGHSSLAAKTVKKALESGRAQHRQQIIEIAKKNNPNFKLDGNLSVYGHKNDAEFFAECFANAFCGNPNELGKAMQEWLRRQGL